MEFVALVVAVALFIIFVASPVLTLAHELGHALAALVLTDRHVIVRQGRQPPMLTVGVGRLELRLRPFNLSPWYAWFGTVETTGASAVSARAGAAIAAAGPPVSLLLAIALGAIADASPSRLSPFLFAAAWAQGYAFLVTAIPMRYGRLFGPYRGKLSDGLRVWQLLRYGRLLGARA
jgi:hypothetical protein